MKANKNRADDRPIRWKVRKEELAKKRSCIGDDWTKYKRGERADISGIRGCEEEAR